MEQKEENAEPLTVQQRLEKEVEQHNKLVREVEDGKNKLEQAENQLLILKGRISVYQEQIQAESPDETTD